MKKTLFLHGFYASGQCWQWRMHITIEQLMAASKFNKKIKTMITRSKRHLGVDGASALS